MKVILLTQYYPPEVGAPQNRLSATALSLHAQGAEVTVLTAMPNYPEMRILPAYQGRFHSVTQEEGITVHRAWLLVSSRRSIFWRLCNYFSFVFTAGLVGLFKLKRADVVFVESPPLFLGITAMFLARAKGAKMVFNVSDLWPESAVQLGLVTHRSLIAMSTWLEELCYRKAALITGQTQGIVRHIKERFPRKVVLWVPNGVDFAAIGSAQDVPPSDIRARYGIGSADLVIAYAGILGHAQGLEVVLEAAALLRDRPDIHFLIVGDGPEKDLLVERKARLDPIRAHFVARMPRVDLLGLMRSVDAVVVPLRKNDLFKGAIPSKIFEALALGKPILLGVDGEARDLFIHEGGAGVHFPPEDAAALAHAAVRYAEDRNLLLQHGASGARYVRAKFDRTNINKTLWDGLRRLV